MILLVEDNPDDEALALRALRKNKIRGAVRIARDGRQAIEEIEKQIPRLVLLDLKIPYIDGHGVLQAIRGRAESRFVPVVVLTTSTEPSDLQRAYECGANSFVQKPVDFVEFVGAMGHICDYWLELNRVPHEPLDDESDGRDA